MNRLRHRVLALAVMLGFGSAAPALLPAGEMELGTLPDVTDDAPGRAARVRELSTARRKRDETVWDLEVRAGGYARVVTRLWDDLRKTADPLERLGRVPLRRLAVGVAGPSEALSASISLRTFGPPERSLHPPDWRAFLAGLSAAGVRLVQTEWHHLAFEDRPAGPVSTYEMSAHAEGRGVRYALRGTLEIAWLDPGTIRVGGRQGPLPADVTVTELELLERAGPPAFEKTFEARFESAGAAADAVLIARDLDGDGRSELLHPSTNSRFDNLGGGRFRERPLLPDPGGVGIPLSLLEDFNGDGLADLLCVAGRDDLWLSLYAGLPGGGFAASPAPASASRLALALPSVFSAGDVDRDGDLDVWLGQWKPPYHGGQMPTPYDDANDGYPSSLLINDGSGTFTDATEASGLAAKRRRRTYSAALVDLDGDRDLDLVTVNDFAGIDVYRNDGTGRFSDVTAEALDETRNFGMGLAVEDLDGDGRLDLYVTGMSSTTARRLDAMGAGRPDRPGVHRSRPVMGYGNRLYLNRGGGRFATAPFNDALARSGWSWGVVGLDVDRDGYRDVYVANGHVSGRSAEDYCSTFWRHDLYAGSSDPDPALARMFRVSLAPLERREISWNGYEKNRLYLNPGGRGFVEAAHLLGAAIEADSRSLVADDFDLDGRPDLALLVKDRAAERVPGRRAFAIVVLMNRDPRPRRWIGVRLSGASGVPACGAVVSVLAGGRTRTAAYVTGDSWRSQQAPLKLFGLGDHAAVDRIRVDWPNGAATTIDRPAVDRYHEVAPPP